MVAALALVAVATLGLSTTTFENQVVATVRASEVVDSWVEGTNLVPVEVDVSSDGVAVTVVGSDSPPPAESLADALAESLDRSVHLTITVVPEIIIEVESGG